MARLDYGYAMELHGERERGEIGSLIGEGGFCRQVYPHPWPCEMALAFATQNFTGQVPLSHSSTMVYCEFTLVPGERGSV
jgi:hypothetical protein